MVPLITGEVAMITMLFGLSLLCVVWFDTELTVDGVPETCSAVVLNGTLVVGFPSGALLLLAILPVLAPVPVVGDTARVLLKPAAVDEVPSLLMPVAKLDRPDRLETLEVVIAPVENIDGIGVPVLIDDTGVPVDDEPVSFRVYGIVWKYCTIDPAASVEVTKFPAITLWAEFVLKISKLEVFDPAELRAVYSNPWYTMPFEAVSVAIEYTGKGEDDCA